MNVSKTMKFIGLVFVGLFAALPAFAEEAAAGGGNGMSMLAAGLGIAIAAFGGALGQSGAAKAALEGIARNPAAADKLFTPLILSLALIESLVLYSFVISFLIQGK